MNVRQFWLSNADDVNYSLMPERSFLYDPSGLGYSVNISTVKLGNTDLILSERYNLTPVTGEILFMGTREAIYQHYQEFVSFLSRKPIYLHYLTPNTNESYNCLVRVISLEKGEISAEDGVMHCPIQMYRQGMWYNDNPNILDATNDVGDGKKYPLDRPYTYGAVGLKNIQLTNNGMTDTSLKVEIFGECTDPEYSIFDDENIQYGACKILGSYDYVRIDSADLNEEIYLERGGSVIPNSANYQDLTVGSPQQVFVTFLKLKTGTSTLMFELGDSFAGYVRITWSNAYVTV